MRSPLKVRRCPYCRGPVYLRLETWQQYKVACYGCSACELMVPEDDIADQGPVPQWERDLRMARYRETTERAGQI